MVIDITELQNGLKHAFGFIGVLTSFSLHASAIPVLTEIYKRKSTMEYIFLPYLLQWINSFCWVVYVFHLGFMLKLEMLISSGGGLMLSSVSLLVFWYFILNRAQRRAFDLTVLGAVSILILLAVSSFTVAPCHSDLLPSDAPPAPAPAPVTTWCWWKNMCITANVCMYGGPVLAMFWSWRKRSVELIPIRFGLGSLISSLPWVLYALAAHDRAVLWPNMVGTCIGMAMLVEYRLIKCLSFRSANLVPPPTSPTSSKSELVLSPIKQALFTFLYMEKYAVIVPRVEIELTDLSRENSRAQTEPEPREQLVKPALDNSTPSEKT